ncbi:MAG: SDR family oxidoreductase, partial [Rhodospirillales bacterium]
MTSSRPLALVTGASSGIGEALARQLAASGHDLALTARSTDKLHALANELHAKHGVVTSVFTVDLALAGAADYLVQALSNAGLRVDVLVNNAGLGQAGALASNDPGEVRQMVMVNVVALTELTRLLLPSMLAERNGRILNVASTAAFQPGPLMAVYYATKAYVLSLSEALSAELKGSGVTATALCPGPVATPFVNRAGMGNLRLFKLMQVMTTDQVARIGLDAMNAGKRVAIAG